MEPIAVLVLLTGFVGALGLCLVAGKFCSRRAELAWQPLQSPPVPFRRRTFLFSAAERSFYKVLRTLVPDHMIFVKVRLADLVSVKPSYQSFWEYFNPINRTEVDFVVCDPTLAPVVAIELDDVSGKAGGSNHDHLVESVLASASVPVVHVAGQRRYVSTELRRVLAPHLRLGLPTI